jgi:SAM-dependent methyltransferase
MREFVREGAFDLALSLFTSFGYFETRAEDLTVLRNIKTNLKPGGVFVIDVISKEYLAGQPCRTHWDELPNGHIVVKHAVIAPGWSRVKITWLLVQGERTLRHGFEHNLYSGQELAALLVEAGFSDIQLFGSLDVTPYDATTTRPAARAVA